ncbi:MAG: hypothetical protein WC780_07005 [Lentimicrobiaceae bacterium]|jgi:hypothetical protein
MDFRESIKAKADELISKADAISKIRIHWQTPVEIDCQALSNAEEFKKLVAYTNLEKVRNKPAIYYFEIKSEIEAKTIVNSLATFKIQEERSCPKIEKKRSLESKYLYCGSIKKGLHGRLIQHLGFGSKNTYGLQLSHWAKELHLVLELNYAWLESDQVESTELIESALAMKIKPLVGKIA